MDERLRASFCTEQIVGYDARDYSDDYETLWPPDRRERFLYRFDVKKVLSVDERVWGSIFAKLGESVRPDQAAMQNLWARLRSLQRALSETVTERVVPAFRTVAITLVDDGTRNVHPTREQAAVLVDPNAISPDWEVLGYDVADAWLLSALSNCGFLPGYDDVGRMRQEWGPRLNEFHLFREPKSAGAFRDMSDQRLASDHAPTFIYCIRMIK